MRGWRSADSGNFASRSWPDGNASAFTTSSRSLPTVGRGVLTAVIAARFITSIKEPEALTFNSNAWFGGSALVPGACYDVHLSFIFLLDVLILLTIAFIHLDRPKTTVANLIVFSTAVACCLVLLMANDRPFATGGITIKPDALRDVGLN